MLYLDMPAKQSSLSKSNNKIKWKGDRPTIPRVRIITWSGFIILRILNSWKKYIYFQKIHTQILRTTKFIYTLELKSLSKKEGKMTWIHWSKRQQIIYVLIDDWDLQKLGYVFNQAKKSQINLINKVFEIWWGHFSLQYGAKHQIKLFISL